MNDIIENLTLFEIPLNNKARTWLRLERVFSDIEQHINLESTQAHYYALRQLFALLDFFQRGDFKSELIKTLDSEITYYASLRSNPAVDLSKLDTFISQLDKLSHWAKSHQGKLGHQLLDNEFLANSYKKLTLNLSCLGFDAPAVKMFLIQPCDKRIIRLKGWLKVFRGVQTSVEVILRLSRETGRYQSVTAKKGYYEEEMEREQFQFIGIQMPEKNDTFPEVSAGANRFCIHFKQLDAQLKTQPFLNDFSFQLARFR